LPSTASLLKKPPLSSVIRSQIHSDDPDHSAQERRFVIIDMSEEGKMLIVAHTDDGEVVRLISAREPTRGEREFYEESRI
jgi:uncharacterized DUF497 family protein